MMSCISGTALSFRGYRASLRWLRAFGIEPLELTLETEELPLDLDSGFKRRGFRCPLPP